MGRGDRFQQPSFSVAMPSTGAWPFQPVPLREACLGESHPCSTCGAELTREGGHYDARDSKRPRKRVCFGRPNFEEKT